jgi:hypothetical protein
MLDDQVAPVGGDGVAGSFAQAQQLVNGAFG